MDTNTVPTILKAFVTDWQRFHSTLLLPRYIQELSLNDAFPTGNKSKYRPQSFDLQFAESGANEDWTAFVKLQRHQRRHSEHPGLPKERHALGRSLRLLMSTSSTNNGQMTVSIKERMAKYWSDSCHPDDHLWDLATGSAECYVGLKDCRNTGRKIRCFTCHLVVHDACLPLLPKKHLKCKLTYADPWVTGRRAMTNPLTRHHWLHCWTSEGRCRKCGKSFQPKLISKEMVAITCSWCKVSYHNKCKCFDIQLIEQQCDLGALRSVIVPARWINKIPTCRYSLQRRSFPSTSSLRRRKRIRKDRIFFVKPIEEPTSSQPHSPLLIFVNVKSGGKKGKKIFSDLCWLVNPRQVFELSFGKGPRFALEMYRKCLHRLRIVVCGGDGTVSWVFSSLDSMKIPSHRYPPIAIVPLGTGNDLSQTMGWGSTYLDENMADVLMAIANDSTPVKFDRWFIDVTPNTTVDQVSDEEKASHTLPVQVMNNYFSIGVDAHIALQFHESRTLKPEIHKSRFKNRLVYGSIGTKDLFKRAWRDLSEYITLECDGVDHTGKIKELGLHCLLILNIPKYAGGTMPWGSQASNLVSLGIWAVNNSIPVPKITAPSYEDGRIEVVGFTAASLAALHVGGRGDRIAQCSTLRLVTRKVIPVQVDGEPCKLAPSNITISLFCKVNMLKRVLHKNAEHLNTLGIRSQCASQKKNFPPASNKEANHSALILKLNYVPWLEYEQLRKQPSDLFRKAVPLGELQADYDSDLETIRPQINNIYYKYKRFDAKPEWLYLDNTGQDELFHVDRAYEVFTTLTDICDLSKGLVIVSAAPAAKKDLTFQSSEEQVNFVGNQIESMSLGNSASTS